jgi:hypothetical protein
MMAWTQIWKKMLTLNQFVSWINSLVENTLVMDFHNGISTVIFGPPQWNWMTWNWFEFNVSHQQVYNLFSHLMKKYVFKNLIK